MIFSMEEFVKMNLGRLNRGNFCWLIGDIEKFVMKLK